MNTQASTQNATQNFTYWQNWDKDGIMEYKNAKTLKRYHALRYERNNFNIGEFECFFAYSDKQFEEGKKSIRPLNPGEKLHYLGAGCYGTKEGMERLVDFYHNIRHTIAKECDPQEVYCFEFNNYESAISYDGDMEAMRVVIDFFGMEAAKRINRFCACQSIEELMKEEA